jgi:hypothetical protein
MVMVMDGTGSGADMIAGVGFCIMSISCSVFQALSVQLVGGIRSMGLQLGPMLYSAEDGFWISDTISGIGRVSDL